MASREALGIRSRFLIACGMLVAATAVSSAWSGWAFHEVSDVVDATVRDSELTTSATATLASALEREDDALLVMLINDEALTDEEMATDEERGKPALDRARVEVLRAMNRLDAVLYKPSERAGSATLASEVAAYERASDDLLAHAHDHEARLQYHERVNPLLRKAVGSASSIRDAHFRSAQEVATWARDRATHATAILAAVTAAALLLSLLVAVYLDRAVVLPIRKLKEVVESMRHGDFERRVPSYRDDEIGQLAEDVNHMAEDLAEFRRANVGEVIRAKETLEATLAALPDAVVVIAPGGEITSTNPRATRVLGADGADAPRTLAELPVPTRTKVAIEAALRGDAPVTSPVVDLAHALSLRLDGANVKLLPRVVPIEGLPEGHRGAVLLLSDVTALARLDEMRTELIAVASHELRTPLTTLRMTLFMLRERAAALEERDRELVRMALLGIDQLAATVDEFLDLTRIEAGQLRLNLEKVDLDALARSALANIQPACDEAGIETVVRGEAPRSVRGDPARLSFVFSNILANAMKYTPAGGRIVVESESTPTEVSLAIEDSGPGVPAEFRERIFEKFFRVEHTREGETGVRGSGIGLYIAREIVQAHGGTLRYEDRGQRGARLVATLPVRDT